jgi:hypothetical protein
MLKAEPNTVSDILSENGSYPTPIDPTLPSDHHPSPHPAGRLARQSPVTALRRRRVRTLGQGRSQPPASFLFSGPVWPSRLCRHDFVRGRGAAATPALSLSRSWRNWPILSSRSAGLTRRFATTKSRSGLRVSLLRRGVACHLASRSIRANRSTAPEPADGSFHLAEMQ